MPDRHVEPAELFSFLRAAGIEFSEVRLDRQLANGRRMNRPQRRGRFSFLAKLRGQLTPREPIQAGPFDVHLFNSGSHCTICNASQVIGVG